MAVIREVIPGKTAYDSGNDMLKISSMQQRLRFAFPGSALSGDWGASLAPGAAATVSGGALSFASGVAAGGESTLLLGAVRLTCPFRLCVGLSLSQRIANQSFLVELVSVTSGLPDGVNVAAWLFDGTTTTQAKHRVSGLGLPVLDSSASTISSTASVTVFEIELNPDDVWFHQRTLDSTSARTYSRVRHQSCPDPAALYALRLRWVNGATPPASSTTAQILFVSLADYAELTAEITAGRGGAVGGLGLAVTLADDANVLPKQGIWWQESLAELAAGATFTGTSRDAGSASAATNSYSSFRALAFSDVACTLQIEIAEEHGSTATTWRKVFEVAIAAGVAGFHSIPCLARHHRVKIVNGGSAQGAFLLHSGFFRTV